MSRIRTFLVAVGLVVGAVVLLYAAYRLPNIHVDNRFPELVPKDRLDAAAALRTQFATLIGVPVACVGAWLTARKFLLDKAKQDIDRFTAAVSLLTSEDSVDRSGGAFALQRLMEDSPRERERGCRVLARSLQQRTRNGEFASRSADLADMVDVLRDQLTGRRNARTLDLTGVRLPGVDFHGVCLPESTLVRADLSDADLRGAELRGADLSMADLTGADLRDADLTGATLRGTRLNNARLSGARLTGADVTGAVFTGADISEAVLEDVDRQAAIGLTPPDPNPPAP